MTPIERPDAGADIRAQWGRDVADALNSLRQTAGANTLYSETPAGASVSALEAHRLEPWRYHAPKPFEARWLDGLNSGAGGYAFYLPANACTVDGAAVDMTANGAAAGLTGFDDWRCYTAVAVPAAGASATVWLEILSGGTGGTYAARLTTTPAASGVAAKMPVAALSTVEMAGVTSHLAAQLAIGQQHFTVSAGGGACAPAKFYNAITVSGASATVRNVAAYSGVSLITGADTTLALNTSGGTLICLAVSLSQTGGASVVPVVHSAGGLSGDSYYIPIWYVDAGGTVYDATIPTAVKRA